MRGYIAITDSDWYEFLRDRGPLDEVNFWTPSGSRRFETVEPGAPIFFKLKTPHNAIGGFGVFTRADVLPDWLAWECFGEQNGAESFEDMRARIEHYRRRNKIAAQPIPHVGCLVIGQPLFFREPDWVRQPSDWGLHTQQGKTYDLSAGEGRRVFEECRQRAEAQLAAIPESHLREAARDVLARYGEGRLVLPRLGQGTFRLAVTDAYGRACAVTGEHSLPALDAAHIRPFGRGGQHAVTNGLLLRADIHRLFDRGYVAVSPRGEFLLSRRLVDDYANGRSYEPFRGQRLSLPRVQAHLPDARALAWHAENVFLS